MVNKKNLERLSQKSVKVIRLIKHSMLFETTAILFVKYCVFRNYIRVIQENIAIY